LSFNSSKALLILDAQMLQRFQICRLKNQTVLFGLLLEIKVS